MEQYDILRLLNSTGQLARLPRKKDARQTALIWLSRHFKHGQIYSEKEVNAILSANSALEDYALLRRELYDCGLLDRTKNGSRYWRGGFMRGALANETVCLRDLCEGDLEPMLAIHESIRYYNDFTGEVYTPELAKAAIEGTDLPQNGHREFAGAKMILTHNHAVAGYLMTYRGYPAPDVLWLAALFLHKNYHRKGIGSAAVRMVEEHAKRCGFAQISLGVMSLNTPGLKFWVGQGFHTIERVCLNEKDLTCLVLSKPCL